MEKVYGVKVYYMVDSQLYTKKQDAINRFWMIYNANKDMQERLKQIYEEDDFKNDFKDFSSWLIDYLWSGDDEECELRVYYLNRD